MDNLPPHKSAAVRALIEATGARLALLPPYSPAFNPIENAFSKLKALLRKAAVRPKEALWQTIGRLLDLFTPTECANYFRAAGYEPESVENALAKWHGVLGPLYPVVERQLCMRGANEADHCGKSRP
jgi:hypothetical protein